MTEENNKETSPDAEAIPPIAGPSALERQTNNPVNDARRLEKIARQQALANALIAQYTDESPWLGLFATLKELGIPWGTYNHWVGTSDTDWQPLMEEIGRARLARVWGDCERGMFTGVGLNRVPYLQGMVNRLDPSMRERVEHSGSVSNVTVTLPEGIRHKADTRKAPTQGTA